ncbi:hypothetical protein [Lentzea sp. NPDC059081]|uniref:hypothetical protein n=1 Tax=Lentzea sp. NPDC059081 TaxID=3346719 RepID=UPI0036B4D150
MDRDELRAKRAKAGRARWVGTTAEQRREAATKASRAAQARAALARRLLAEYEAAANGGSAA